MVDGISAPSLQLFGEVPVGYLAHGVTDCGCAPLILQGEVAIVSDEPNLYPEPGGWYLIEHTRGKSYFSGRERRVREIAVAVQDRRGDWWTRPAAPRVRGTMSAADGPYSDFNLLADKILGRVVGIYQPNASGGSDVTCSVT